MRPVPLAPSRTCSHLSWRRPMPDLQFKATINGRKISRNAKPHQRLLDFIRDDLNLTGNKEGCGAGECGTCSVFVDGTLVKHWARALRLPRNRKRRSNVMARKRGRGMAACWYGIARTAVIDRAAAWVEIDDGGSAKVVTGVTEIGEGILTVLAQIAAHEMGVKPEHVVIGDNDTARAPEASHAGASRQTYMIGNAVALASREAHKRLVEVMAEIWDVEPATIQTGNGEIWAENTNHRITMGEAVHTSKGRGVVPVGSASVRTDTTALDPA